MCFDFCIKLRIWAIFSGQIWKDIYIWQVNHNRMMELIIPLIVLFLSAFFVPVLNKLSGEKIGYILSIMPLGIFFYFLSFLGQVADGNFPAYSIAWFPALGINFSFYLDGLSLLFVLLVSGMGALVFLYAAYYMKSYPLRGRFFFYITLFMGAMIGLVMADSLITMFLFWELTSVCSFLLIGFNHDKPEARSAALQSLLITVFGGLALLAGVVMIGMVTGGYEISDLLSQGEFLRNHSFYLPILLLIFIGAFTKSAQFPFHFWLPGAMQAPSPVSAYLHSATMVKAGIYLLARLNPVLGGTIFWQYSLTLVGATTMLVGAYLALTQTDLKKILAYTTVSALGILVLMVGIGTDLAIKALVIFLIVHSFYKGSLFMIAGAIDKTTGTRDIRKLGGLYRAMPLTTIATLLTLFSMAGLPPFLGFIGKEIIYDAKIQAPDIANGLTVLVVSANAIMVAVAMLLGYAVFFGKKGDTPKIPKEPSWPLLAGAFFLSVASMVMGIFPSMLTEPLAIPAIAAVKAVPVTLQIKLWHGFNLVLLLSLITVGLGTILFAFRKKVVPVLIRINEAVFYYDFASGFSRLIDGFLHFSKRQTNVIQHGYHRFYLMFIFIAASVLVWTQLSRTGIQNFQFDFSAAPFYLIGISLLIIVSTLAALITKSRLVAIVSLGVIGFSMSVIFILYGAVDVAITLILVETLIVILFVMIIYHLPQYIYNVSKRSSRVRDAIIALIFGGFMTVLVLKAEFTRIGPAISDYFMQNSFTEAHGRNIVNVILVDFRALDTFGESIVLIIAAIGVFSLLKLKPKKKQE